MLDTEDTVRCPNCLRRHAKNICYYCGVDKMTANERKNLIKDRANKTAPPQAPEPAKPTKATKPAKVPAPPKLEETPAPKPQKLKGAKFNTAGLDAKQADELRTEATKVGATEDGLLSVSDIARELGIDPKLARSRLRKHRGKAQDGRWPKVARDSVEHKEIVALMQEGDETPDDESGGANDLYEARRRT